MRFTGLLTGLLAATGIAASLAASDAARAAPGVVVGGVDLRAGPGEDYPAIAPLPPGTGAEIFGCLPGWSWCDVAVNGPDGTIRGWAAGERLQVLYGNQPGYLPQYGAAVGLPLIGFSLGSYWDRYYRGEPWYGSEGRYRGRGYGGPGYAGEGYGRPGYGGPGYGRPGYGGPGNGGPGPGGERGLGGERGPGSERGPGGERGPTGYPGGYAGQPGPGRGGPPQGEQRGGFQSRPAEPGRRPDASMPAGPRGGGHDERGRPDDHRPN